MANVTKTQEFLDGTTKIFAEVLDNGCVRFAIQDGATSAAVGALGWPVLEQLAKQAQAAEKPTHPSEDA
jgi:hypothetical protein